MTYNRIMLGNNIDTLKTLPDCSVNCCVTSPPYYGLRDYGIDGQIGLEETPQKYIEKLVKVFREVKRVLRDDGTLWVNIGDSYAGSGKGATAYPENAMKYKQGTSRGMLGAVKTTKIKTPNCKKKDLIGIPWALAQALKSPYYSGCIRKEIDRVWLAAMIDAEGCICGFHHIRKDDNSDRTGIEITITNSNINLLDRAFSIYPCASKHIHQKNGESHLGKRDIWRWHVFSISGKKNLIAEIYPYLIAKKKQAIIAWNFLHYQEKAKHYGHTPQKDDVIDIRRWMVETLSRLNKGEDVDLPSWVVEPPSLYEQGYYLRQDIIWHKPNPMPESVTDRCVKSHEYIFLLSKSARYYFDSEAIKQKSVGSTKGKWTSFKRDGSKRGVEGVCPGKIPTHRPDREDICYDGDMRNCRDVWTVATEALRDAHFAVFPPNLITPCVLAGCPRDGVVLDPFMGSGTTGMVAIKNLRKYIGCEINPEYVKIAEQRIANEKGLWDE